MEGHHSRQILQIFVLFAALINVAYSSLAGEISENEESVRFDGVYKLADWTATNKTEVFQATTQTAVDGYCSANAAMCQLETYSALEVVVEEEKVEYFNGDIKITFHVLLPASGVSSDSELMHVLAKDTVSEIMMLNSTRTALDSAVGNTLSYVGDERLEGVDYSLDVIMIPVVCVLFLLVVLLALILVCRESHKEKKKNQAADGVMRTSKGEEGITLTAVKSASDDSGENNEVKA